ncbi:MAG: WbqC family protein, partial [Muribaculaceae bacterium]|nr:WbqC family protein [Muribaculaceae bacterium]
MLPPLLFPPVGYYQRIIAGDDADYAMRYDKRLKDTHRYTIASTRGALQLTVPIEHIWNGDADARQRPTPLTWGDIPLSTHNQWWDKHRVALESAYGRTPYFEFYIDRLLPLLSADTPQHIKSVAQLCRCANDIVSSILML